MTERQIAAHAYSEWLGCYRYVLPCCGYDAAVGKEVQEFDCPGCGCHYTRGILGHGESGAKNG